MPKIPMTTPLVEMDGDEMTRVLWQMIKDVYKRQGLPEAAAGLNRSAPAYQAYQMAGLLQYLQQPRFLSS